MSKQVRADIILILITIVWGSSFALMKNVLELLPAFAYLSLRFIIAAVVLIAIFHKRLKLLSRKALLHGCIIGLMLFEGMAFQVFGLYYTTASNSAFITGMYVVFVPIVSTIFLKKKPDLSSIVGVAAAFSGLIMLCGGINFKFNFGDFLTLICSFCWTFQIILIDRYVADNDPAVLAIVQVGICAILYSSIWGVAYPTSIALNLTTITILLITGVLGSAFAFAAQTIVQKDTSPTHTVLIFTAEPVFGSIFAAIIPNSSGVTETIGLSAIIGSILIIGGMLVSQLRPNCLIKKSKSEYPATEILDETE